MCCFRTRGANDAIELSGLEFVVLLLGGAGLVVTLFAARQRRGAVGVGSGVFLLGVAVALVVGLIVFGNLSNDRFAPLLFLAPLFGFAGLVTFLAGLAFGGVRRDLILFAASGFVAAVVVAVWTLIRGSRDWLLAPYGFDIAVLAVVLGAAVAMLAARVGQPRTPG